MTFCYSVALEFGMQNLKGKSVTILKLLIRAIYHLRKKNLPACLYVYLWLESTNHKKIGEINKALQICKRFTQTASLLLYAIKSYLTLIEILQFRFCHFYTKFK